MHHKLGQKPPCTPLLRSTARQRDRIWMYIRLDLNFKQIGLLNRLDNSDFPFVGPFPGSCRTASEPLISAINGSSWQWTARMLPSRECLAATKKLEFYSIWTRKNKEMALTGTSSDLRKCILRRQIGWLPWVNCWWILWVVFAVCVWFQF